MSIQVYQVTEQASDTHQIPFDFSFPYDLTGATITCELKEATTDQAKVSEQYTVEHFLIDPYQTGNLKKGRVVLSLSASQTASLLPYDSGASELSKVYYSSVRVTLPNGFTQSLFRIQLTIEAVTTRAGST